MNELTMKVEFVIKFLVAADRVNTFKLLNKSTIGPKRIMVLCCLVNFEQFKGIDIMLSLNFLFFI